MYSDTCFATFKEQNIFSLNSITTSIPLPIHVSHVENEFTQPKRWVSPVNEFSSHKKIKIFCINDRYFYTLCTQVRNICQAWVNLAVQHSVCLTGRHYTSINLYRTPRYGWLISYCVYSRKRRENYTRWEKLQFRTYPNIHAKEVRKNSSHAHFPLFAAKSFGVS